MLTLERVKGQRAVQEIVKIPRPSQLDDWQLYEKYEGEMVKQTGGDRGFLDWKMAKAQERMDLEQWRRTMHLGLELNLAKLSKDNDKGRPQLSPATQSKDVDRQNLAKLIKDSEREREESSPGTQPKEGGRLNSVKLNKGKDKEIPVASSRSQSKDAHRRK